MEDIKNIIESLLFVAEEPLTVDRLKKILNLAGIDEIHAALYASRDILRVYIICPKANVTLHASGPRIGASRGIHLFDPGGTQIHDHARHPG